MRLALLAEAEAELELLQTVRAGLDVILEAPDTWVRWPGAPARIPPIRPFALPRFPYSIAYQAHGELVVVLAIVHGQRRPLYWIGRAP